MPSTHPAPSDEHTLADSAHELQRAAGHVQKHADALPPEARALCFHLRAVADALRAPRDACTSSRIWTRRLLDAYSGPAHESELRLDAPHAACGSSGQTLEDASNRSPARP